MKQYLTSLLCCLITSLVFADKSRYEPTLPDFFEAIQSGKPHFQFRLRDETFDTHQAGKSNGHATTLRTKLGYETDEFYHLLAYLEFVNVSSFLTTRHNPDVDGLRKPQYVPIPDPKGSGLTQANLRFQGIEATEIRLGRQAINLDNERLISSKDFRQFPQTFDAFSITNDSLPDLKLLYNFLHHQYSSFSNDRIRNPSSLRSHLLRAAWEGREISNVIGYILFHRDKTTALNSNLTSGIKILGKQNISDVNSAGYIIEYARQKQRANNPVYYHANYLHLNSYFQSEIYQGGVGLEYFGSQSILANHQFRTPLGNSHAYLGTLDLFDPIPTRGIYDLYFNMGLKLSGFNFMAHWHQFKFLKGNSPKKPGSELDLDFGYQANNAVWFGVGYGNFYPKRQSTIPKTKKIWLTAQLTIK